MKKMIRLTILTALVLLAVSFLTVQAEEQLPAEILDFFAGDAFSGAEIKASASWNDPDGDGFRGFVPVDELSVPASLEENYEVFTGSDGEQYDLFEVRKLFYDEHHHVYAVSGVYERVVMDDDCYGGKIAEDGTFTYNLAPDFQAVMVDPESWDLMEPYVPVPDLYAWYIDAYRGGEEPESGELIFQCDLPEDEQDNAEVDFWFITTRIRLNEMNEIEYMQYYYVPWG